MRKQVKGVISNVSEKPWEDRRTGKKITLYSFQIEGSNQWLRNQPGTTPLPYGVGTYVTFIQDGQNVDMDTLEKVEGEAAPPARPQTAGTAGDQPKTRARGAATQSRDGYWAEKERRDIEREKRYQAVSEPRMALSVATEAASRVVVAALQTEALSYGNIAKGQRYKQLSKFVREIATDLAVFIEDAPNVLAKAKAETEAESSEETSDD